MTYTIASQPNLQPTLVGDTVEIRPLRVEDWGEMFAAASDPLIWELHPVPDRYTEPVFRKYFDGGMETNSAFAIVERANGSIIGSSRFHGYDTERREIEIGWTFLIRRHWGGVTNHEVKRLMLSHAFTFVDTVVFQVGIANWRSQGAMGENLAQVRREGIAIWPSVGGAYIVFEITKAAFRL